MIALPGKLYQLSKNKDWLINCSVDAFNKAKMARLPRSRTTVERNRLFSTTEIFMLVDTGILYNKKSSHAYLESDDNHSYQWIILLCKNQIFFDFLNLDIESFRKKFKEVKINETK